MVLSAGSGGTSHRNWAVEGPGPPAWKHISLQCPLPATTACCSSPSLELSFTCQVILTSQHRSQYCSLGGCLRLLLSDPCFTIHTHQKTKLFILLTKILNEFNSQWPFPIQLWRQRHYNQNCPTPQSSVL